MGPFIYRSSPGTFSRIKFLGTLIPSEQIAIVMDFLVILSSEYDYRNAFVQLFTVIYIEIIIIIQPETD